MKLGATITSERGKTVSKTGNERLDIQLTGENQKSIGVLALRIINDHIYTAILFRDGEGVNLFSIDMDTEEIKTSENLRHDKKNDYCNECMSHGCKQL